MSRYEKIQNDKNTPIRILSFYINKDDFKTYQQSISEAHWHENLEILLPIKGNLDVYDNQKYLKVNEGNIYIINSKNIHQVNWDRESDYYQGHCLQIDMNFINNIIPEINDIEFKQPDKVIGEAIRRNFLELIVHSNQEDPYFPLYINGMINMIVYILITESSIEKKDDKNKKIRYNQRILDILSYIEKHYKEDLSLDALAKEFNMSTGHFSKIFKEQLGITPKDYIINYRLTNAAVDLIETDETIIDIAFEHGFTNIKSFYTLFKREYGMLPTQYRKNMRK